jgi:hypothetical protein
MKMMSNIYPKVSVPIVCEEFMRASGFFYNSEDSTYLVTAAHNVVPTKIKIEDSNTGALLTDYSTGDYFPSIDIFLRSGDSWTAKNVDIADPEVTAIHSDRVDILLIEISFDPGEYGYQVWEKDDLTNIETEEQQPKIVGFNGDALPDKSLEYSTELYCQELDEPSEVNPEIPSVDGMTGTPLYSVTLDTAESSQYDGLSGAPLIGDGLIGVHVVDDPLPDAAIEQLDFPKSSYRLGHFRAKIISQMVS